MNGASPASGTISLTIPWKLSTSGLNPQTISLNLGTVGGSDGLTQADAPSVLDGTNIDGTPYGSVTGVTVDKDGTVTAQFSNGLSQDVYKIPLATFTNPERSGPDVGQRLCRDQGQRRPQHQSGRIGHRGLHPVQIAGKFDRRSRD